jgi:PPE-repeat protein
MDYGALPPEINSGRMYSGPGCGSMLAAATTWDGLAEDLHSTAASYQPVIWDLTGAAWLGPASVAMTAATDPYLSWVTKTAELCEQTATQARAAAAAYEAAFAITVPPPMVAANRAQLMALIATNILGQNTPAIAATEGDYGEMWAQDAGAMYEYASASAAASALPPFTSPPPTTNPAGVAGQVAAVAHSSATSAGAGSFLQLLSLLSPVNLTVASASTAITSTGMPGRTRAWDMRCTTTQKVPARWTPYWRVWGRLREAQKQAHQRHWVRQTWGEAAVRQLYCQRV